MTEKVFITGAGGFLGGWFAEALHLQGRYQVVAGLNSWSGAARIARFPIDFVQANLLDPVAIERALEGVGIVIHCAIIEDNALSVRATRNLVEAAKKAGVRHFVHISSVSIYGEAAGVVTEDTVPVGPVTEYGIGKQQTEDVVREYAAPGFRVSVLRPGIIYGPFSTSWTLPAITRIRAGNWRSLGAKGDGKANLVYAGDVVRLAQFLIERQTEDYGVYNSIGPETPTWNGYYERVSEAMGHGPLQSGEGNVGFQVMLRRPIRAVGKYVLKNHRNLLTALTARSYFVTDTLRKVEEDLRLKPNEGEMALFGRDVVYTDDKARALGFTPPTSVDQGVAYSVEWAQKIGLI